jgi:hypothetical protein
MSRGLAIESPLIEDPALQDWYNRLLIQISAEFERGVQLEPQGYKPNKPREGQIIYFKGESSMTDGPYFYNGTDWVPMFGGTP